MRKAVLVAVSIGWALLPAAASAGWQALPGVADVEVDTASVQLQPGAVTAWLRVVGNAATARAYTGGAAKLPPAFRTLLHAQVDCRAGSLRVLAAQGHAATGVPVYMSSVPGPVRPIAQDERLAWAYDALCELARDAR